MKALQLQSICLAGLLGMVTTASSQLVISTTNSPTTITFDTNTSGIYQARTGTGLMRNITEKDAFDLSPFNANKASTFLTGGVASAHQYTQGYTGSGNGSSTRFQDDANGDGTTNQNVGNVSQRVWRPDETSPLQGGNPTGDYSQLASNAFRLSVNAGFDNSAQYFRIQNNTGGTITDWTFTADIFYFEPDASGFSNLTFAYAIDNGVNPDAMTFTTFGTAPAITQGATLATLAGTLNTTVTTAGVANGGYIILTFRDTATSVSGSTIFLDNIGITAVSGGDSLVVPVGVDVAIVGADVQLTFNSVSGQSYQLLVSTDDMASFAPVAGASDNGDGNPLTLTHVGGAPASGGKVFYQIETN